MKSLTISLLIIISLSINFLFSQNIDTIQDKYLEDVVISATKFPENKRNVAQNFDIITPLELKMSNFNNTADLLSSLSGVYVQKSQQGGGSTVLRGFEASRVLYVVDGIRLNNLIYRAGHLQNIMTIDQSALAKVEILYGPGSTVFGSDALGGVIHLITKNPELAEIDEKVKFKANGMLRYGSVNQEKTGHIDFNIGGKKFGSFTSVSYSDFEDSKMGKTINPFYGKEFGTREYYVERINGQDSIVENKDKYLQKFSGFSQYDLLQKFLYKQSDNVEHILNFQFSNSSDIPRYDRLTDLSSNNFKYAEWYYGPQERLLAAYEINCKNKLGFDNVSFNVNYQKIEESRHQRKYRKSGLQHRTENVDIVGLNLDFNKLYLKNEFRIGIDEQYNTLKSTAFEENIETGEKSALDTRYPNGENFMNSIAFFFTHTRKINKKIVLNDGLRVGYTNLYSSFTDESFYEFPFSEIEQKTPVYSANFGIIILPNLNNRFSINLSSGFRVPNVDDLTKIFESADGKVIVPNPNIKPEKTINCDLAYTLNINNKFYFDNVFYGTYYFDAFLLDDFQYNGSDSILYDGIMSKVYANKNQKTGYLYGYSGHLKTEIAKNLNFEAMFNYTYGRIKTDSVPYPLDHIPPSMLKLFIDYSFKDLYVEFSGNYNSWKHLDDYNLDGEDNLQYATAEGIPAWYTLNFSLSYTFVEKLILQFEIDNILDLQYRTFASGINASGRNFIFGIKYNL